MYNLNYKKLTLILGFIIIVFILGYLIYALFFKPAAPTPPPEGEAPPVTGELPEAKLGPEAEIIGPPGRLPGAEEVPGIPPEGIPSLPDEIAKGRITETTALNQVASLAPTLASNGSALLYYNREDDKFYRIDRNGRTTLLSDKKFFNVQNVTWAPDKNKAILEYPDGSNILYNFNTKKQATLPKHWEDFDFSTTGDQIVAKSLGLDPDNRWLVIANDDGSKAQLIEPLGKNADKVLSSWSPNNLSIALFEESIDFDRQKVYFIGKNKENFKSATIEGRGFQPKWTPDGERLLYSVYSSANNLKPSLWLVDAKGETIGANRKQLELQTWANKCNLANSITLYCAVPKTLPEGAGLFPELAEQTTDNIYKVNLKTGAKTLIAIPDGDYNIADIVVSQDEGNLYFTDKVTGRIYKIKLR